MKVHGRLMQNSGRAALCRKPKKRGLGILLVALGFTGTMVMQTLVEAQEASIPVGVPPPYAQQSPQQLQQLVAPIALYPDSLVAQILTAATFPEQIVEADRWVQSNAQLQGAPLAQAVNQQSWDASVKALIAFPAVLGNMDKNLAWTSSLGDAYYNQPQDIMAAIQVMRQRAQVAGSLTSTAQQIVTTQDSDISIEPADPDVIYVPEYDPWIVYGIPVLAWPDWYPYPGIWYVGPTLVFGVGFPIGVFDPFGWGWHHWGLDWRHHFVLNDHRRYLSGSTTFYNRGNFYRSPTSRSNVGSTGQPGPRPESPPSSRLGVQRGGIFNSPGVTARPFNGNVPAARGYGEPRGQSGIRSGAFSGFGHGGDARSFSSRGSASFGSRASGGGAVHGGGGRPR